MTITGHCVVVVVVVLIQHRSVNDASSQDFSKKVVFVELQNASMDDDGTSLCKHQTTQLSFMSMCVRVFSAIPIHGPRGTKEYMLASQACHSIYS